ncbi:hypothetical protein TanjilG_00259, partial [Lupinus angustifolius]
IVFQNMHQDYPTETLLRFLKAREWNVGKAHKMKPISADLYRAVRDSQLIGMSELPEPDPDDAKIVKAIETEFHKLENQNSFSNKVNGVAINGH